MSKLYDSIDDKYKDYLGKSLFVLSLFVLGLLVYLFVTKPFLHIDERFTMGLLDISFKEMVHLTAIDVHPPLYYAFNLIPVYILKGIFHLQFDKILLMKIMAVLPYVAIFIISLTKIRKDYGWLAGGLFAFTLLTMSDFFTMFSIGRMYPLGMLFLLLAFLYACDILREPSLKKWLLLAFFSLCGAYTHYFVAVGLVVLYVILFIHFLMKNREELKNWLISTVVGIVLYIPWLLVLYKQMKSVHGSYWIEKITIVEFVEFFSSIFTVNTEFMANIFLAIIAVAIFIVIILKYYKSQGQEDSDIALLGILIFLGTIAVGVFMSFVFKPIFIVRYLAPATGIVWLAFSIFLSKFEFKKIIIPVVIVILLFSAFNLSGQIADINRNHDALVKDQQFLDSINNNDSVVIIDGMVKYVHFHGQLNNSIVYGGFSVDKPKNAKDFTKFFDDKDKRFTMPDDFNKYKNKTVYFVYRKGSDIDMPSYVSHKKVGQVDNTIFWKLKYKD